MFFNYLMIGVCCIVTILVLIFMITNNYVIKKTYIKYFLATNIATIFVVLCEMCTSYFEFNNISFNGVYIVANVVGFTLSPTIAWLYSLSFNDVKSKWSNILVFPLVINCIMAVLSPKYEFIFSCADGIYKRGDLFFVYIIAYVCSAIYLLIQMINTLKLNQRDGRVSLSILFLFTILGTSIQILYPQIHASWLCVTFTLVLLYAYFCETSQKEDVVTALFNRSAYQYYLTCVSKKSSVEIIILDIDNFKLVNDKYGHQFGDQCLKLIADNIKSSFSHLGKCYRIGGDEFCVICPIPNEKLVKKAIDVFDTKMECVRNCDENFPSVSLGTATYHKGDGDILGAVEEADKQMYCNKESSKNNL